MASVRTFTLPHYDAYPVHVALFKHVKNAAFLRRQLLEANPAYDYAFLDASMILSPRHLLSATFLALHAHLTHRAKTRTPHSELVFRLSPNNNIGESYNKFGIADTTTTLIAVKLPLSPSSATSTDEKSSYEKDETITNESVSALLGGAVEGTAVPIDTGDELGMWCDVDKVRKVYKLGGGHGGNKGKKGTVVNGSSGHVEKKKTEENKEIESLVLGMIALKGS